MPQSHPVIVVPGITASYLRDDYTVPPEIVWSVLAKDYERSALHPDNIRYEAIEPANVQPDQIFEIAYSELIEELKYNLRDAADNPVPVYPFSYDWRQPLERVEERLNAFIDDVIERTKLMRNYDADNYAADPRVNLVGHSMGGLVIAGCLQRYGGARIGKVATLATPYQGSFEAVVKVTTGTANLGVKAPSSREREAARITPALYHLLPSFKNGVEVAPGLPDSLFDRGAWQGSIVGTISESIRLHGLPRGGTDTDRAEALFADMLKMAGDHRKRFDDLDLSAIGLDTKNWLCVVGAGSTTRVRVKVAKADDGASFVFRSGDRADEWEDGSTPEERRLTGDGTVPFEGAIPKFLPYESLVCVTPDDYGYWEWKDIGLTKAAGFHGILPNMNMLHRLIVAHFTGSPDTRGNIWGRVPPGVVNGNWAPPIPNLKSKG